MQSEVENFAKNFIYLFFLYNHCIPMYTSKICSCYFGNWSFSKYIVTVFQIKQMSQFKFAQIMHAIKQWYFHSQSPSKNFPLFPLHNKINRKQTLIQSDIPVSFASHIVTTDILILHNWHTLRSTQYLYVTMQISQ